MNRLALVTGAGGFIPSHLVEALVKSGWRVRGLLRYGSAGDVGCLTNIAPEVFAELDIRRGDLLDGEFVAECCKDVDTVFNLAARISIPYSYIAPRDTFQVNVMGTLNVVEAVRRCAVRRLVQVSTSEIFGSAVTVPMSETHRLKAQSPYAASKIAADKIVESCVCSFGLPAVIVRPFNTFGPRQSPRAVIPSLIEQALRGGVIRVGSLWPRRDFTYVTDTVEGLIRAACCDAALRGEFNLGAGTDVSIGELAEMVIRIVGKPCELASDETLHRPAASEVTRLCSDNSRARKILGWQPRHTLEEGLAKTVEWWRHAGPQFHWGSNPT